MNISREERLRRMQELLNLTDEELEEFKRKEDEARKARFKKKQTKYHLKNIDKRRAYQREYQREYYRRKKEEKQNGD